ncbi:hypothetical protein P43SY_000199 [Pythium insidiosum]|uniref:Lipoyl-binding domain-containing protein n=1 Tax=Pythium insidiosum TaxID=114742 RepID=A0AAD5M9U7_PYTIN|nr:hypothetical protein P43SY_000199 [Pythium insidiosum]
MLSRALVLRHAALRRCSNALIARSFSSYPPHEVVGLPALSPTMEQGNLASWRLKEGDKISAGDIICQIETDKAVVDFEAQDDMYLAKILVPEGTENILIGQPIMVTTDEEEHLEGLKNFKLDASFEVASPEPKAPEELPPKKEQVAVDPVSQAPVVPQDFLTTHKNVQGTPIPAAPAAPAAKPAAPAAAAPAPAAQSSETFAEKWGFGVKKSPLSFSLIKKQQAYIDLYGITGTTPVSSSSKN